MAGNQTEAPDTVSREAFERVQQERDQLKEQNADLTGQLDASRKVSKVESFLRSQEVPEEEIPTRVELLSPHLPEIPMDKVAEKLSEDRFKPLTSVAPAPSNGQEGDDGETTPTTPTEPEGGFGNQPSPGGDHQPVTHGQVGPGDDEYEAARQAAMKGDHSKMQKLYEDDRVKEPTRTW